MFFEDNELCRINGNGNYRIPRKSIYPTRMKCNSNPAICEGAYPKL
jgi:hypothetical protein